LSPIFAIAKIGDKKKNLLYFIASVILPRSSAADGYSFHKVYFNEAPCKVRDKN